MRSAENELDAMKRSLAYTALKTVCLNEPLSRQSAFLSPTFPQ